MDLPIFMATLQWLRGKGEQETTILFTASRKWLCFKTVPFICNQANLTMAEVRRVVNFREEISSAQIWEVRGFHGCCQ